jgi:DinB superfamily
MNDTAVSPRATPGRLAPFLAQWDYMVEVLTERLTGLTDEEFLWQPAPNVWTVRAGPDGLPIPDVKGWAPTGAAGTPPRTLAWSIDHLGAGGFERADYLVGSHSLKHEDLSWPMTADEGVAFMLAGLAAWRTGLDQMTDEDLDTVGRSAFPRGLDPTLPLIEIVWWMNKELIFHSAEIWFARDLYSATR